MINIINSSLMLSLQIISCYTFTKLFCLTFLEHLLLYYFDCVADRLMVTVRRIGIWILAIYCVDLVVI